MELTDMSQNKKKQTAKQSQSSNAKTNDETKNDGKQNSTESGEKELKSPSGGREKEQGPLVPSGATMETGAGDPRTDAPAGAPEGAHSPEDTVAGGAEPPEPEEPSEGTGDDEDDTPESREAARLHGSGISRDSIDYEEPLEKPEDAEPVQPVDENTAKVTWESLPTEGKPEGKILQPGDEVSFDGTRHGGMVTVNEDVYREVTPRGAKRPSYVLLYKAGTQVPATSVQSRSADESE